MLANGVVGGAEKLGWSSKIYDEPATLEGYIATWNQVLQATPNFIVYFAGLPNSIISAQLAKAAQLKIPAVAIGSTEAPNDVMRATIGGSATSVLTGQLMGASIVADAKGAATTAFVWDPTTSLAFGPLKNSFTQEVTAAGGTVNVLGVSSAEVGKDIPGQVVSYLQTHPSVKYMAFAPAVFLAGVPEALKVAGITDVKIVSYAPSTSDLAAIKSGTEWVSVATENEIAGYRTVDTLARIAEGMPFDANPAGLQQILTASNVTGSLEPATQGSPVDAFLAAWHVG